MALPRKSVRTPEVSCIYRETYLESTPIDEVADARMMVERYS
jgi:hypothetical protein